MINRKTILLVLGVCVFTYANALFNGFAGDAKGLFDKNAYYDNPSNITRLFTKDFLVSPGSLEGSFEAEQKHYSGFVSYRPVTGLSFFADSFIWKKNPFGFHLTNVLLHFAVCLLVFVLASLLTKSKNVALLAALLFCVHPVQSELVCSIGYRSPGDERNYF